MEKVFIGYDEREMEKVFIGYDEREAVAYNVLSHSILKRSSIPIAIVPLRKELLRGFFNRQSGEYDSTDFAISRFLVPYLCGYEGSAVFMDCDMVCLGDIADLFSMSDDNFAVQVVKHNYTPDSETKFLGQKQTKYEKKNWSSVMLFNNERCPVLTPTYVEKAEGLDLHQFKWTSPFSIGEIPMEWNWLIDVYEGTNAKLLHYTNGTPCFIEYMACTGSDIWHNEYRSMISCG